MFDSLPKEGTVHIVLQRVPDPDAIGSALGAKWLLERRGLLSQILAHSEPSHSQTRAMVNVLGVDIKTFEEVEGLVPETVLILDSPYEGTHWAYAGFDDKNTVFYAIDHHKWEPKKCKAHVVEPVGACATLIAEMIRDDTVEDPEEFDDKIVATALLLGIYSDTDGLMAPQITDRDFKAFQYLNPKVDRAKLGKITHYPIPESQFALEARAIESRVVEGSKLVACLGEAPAGYRDVMPVVADRLLRMAGVGTVVVFAFIDNHVEASVRSSDSTLDVDKFCKDVFGEQFHGTAGSKQGGIGGGRAPLGIALVAEDDDEDREEALAGLETRLKKRILRRLGE